MARVLLLIALSSGLSAQIQDLATTADGHHTYFSAAYRLKGTDQPGYLKIFRYAENGFETFRQLKLEMIGPDPNFYLAERPSVSGDGHAVAYTASTTCSGGSHCVSRVYHQGWVAALDTPDRNLSTGMLGLSPDGKYVIAFAQGGPFRTAPVVSDLAGGTSIEAKGFSVIGDGRQAIANGGIALLSGDGPVLWHKGNTHTLSLAAPAFNAGLSADARKVVYEAQQPGAVIELHSYDVATRRDLVLATTPGGQTLRLRPTLTYDGALVAYILNGQLRIQGTDGSAPRELTAAPEGVTDATISGFGNLAYAATANGRLLRIDVVSGAVTELSLAVPHIDMMPGGSAPGGLVDIAFTGAPGSAGDPVLLASGARGSIVARSGSTVTFQVPWEAQPGSTASIVVPANPSLFEEAHELTVEAGIPQFFYLPTPPGTYSEVALAAHQDFSAIVTADNPARPGEIIHLYFTGLGAVAPSLATGAATPTGTLYRVQNPFSCQFEADGRQTPATILFAGLAPGFVGIDQVDLQVPPGIGNAKPFLHCTSAAGATSTRDGFAQIPLAP